MAEAIQVGVTALSNEYFSSELFVGLRVSAGSSILLLTMELGEQRLGVWEKSRSVPERQGDMGGMYTEAGAPHATQEPQVLGEGKQVRRFNPYRAMTR